MTPKTTRDLRDALAALLDATVGLDAPHILEARDRAAAVLDKVEGFDSYKWERLCQYIAPTGRNRGLLSKEVRRELDAMVWGLQDGYGAQGKTPVQGWDWSGIRDSSRRAKAAIIKGAETILGTL